MREDNPTSKNTELPAAQIAKNKSRFTLSRELCLRILVILIVIGISAGIFVFRDKVANLEGYGYLGAFLISLVSCATIILPIPGIALIFALGDTYNPFLVGLAAGAGSALGEISGYMAGYSGQMGIRNNKTYPCLGTGRRAPIP